MYVYEIEGKVFFSRIWSSSGMFYCEDESRIIFIARATFSPLRLQEALLFALEFYVY